MALITRVSRLFRADLHAVLDRIEEPEVLLRQAVREMEEEFAHGQQRLKLMQHEHGQLAARENDIAQSLSEVEEELDVCFDSDNDDLARVLIKRKLEAQRFLKALRRKREGLEEAASALKAQLDENRTCLDGMRQKAELFVEEESTTRPDESWTTSGATVRDEDVEVALLREKQRRRRS